MQENKLTHETYTPVKWGPGYLGLFFSVTGFACLLSLPHICRQKKSLFNWDSKRWDHSLKSTIFYTPKAWNIRLSRPFECLKPKNSKIWIFEIQALKKPKTLQHQNMVDSLKRKIETRTTHEKYKILKKIDRGNFCASVTKNNNIHNQTLSQRVKTKQKLYVTRESNSSTKKRQWVRQPLQC